MSLATITTQAESLAYTNERVNMKPSDLAAELNGREYGSTGMPFSQQAKENGLVIVTGYSDDNVEFEGAIRDEVGAYNGAEIALDAGGIIEACDEPCDHCDQETKITMATQKVIAKWDAEGYSWFITVEGVENVAYFDLFEDGEKHTRGAVFAKADLK